MTNENTADHNHSSKRKKVPLHSQQPQTNSSCSPLQRLGPIQHQHDHRPPTTDHRQNNIVT